MSCFCDDGRIQTCNLLSRNQMRYSVAPHRHDVLNYLFCDDGRIQTCNLLSRNQVRYSVAPHRHVLFLNGANIGGF